MGLYRLDLTEHCRLHRTQIHLPHEYFSILVDHQAHDMEMVAHSREAHQKDSLRRVSLPRSFSCSLMARFLFCLKLLNDGFLLPCRLRRTMNSAVPDNRSKVSRPNQTLGLILFSGGTRTMARKTPHMKVNIDKARALVSIQFPHRRTMTITVSIPPNLQKRLNRRLAQRWPSS